MCSGDCGVGGGSSGHVDVSRKPGESIGDSFGASFVGIDSVASIVVQSRTKVPAVNAMRCPRFAIVGFVVNEDFCAGWSQWCTVEIELTEDQGLSG